MQTAFNKLKPITRVSAHAYRDTQFLDRAQTLLKALQNVDNSYLDALHTKVLTPS